MGLNGALNVVLTAPVDYFVWWSHRFLERNITVEFFIFKAPSSPIILERISMVDISKTRQLTPKLSSFTGTMENMYF